MGMTVAAFKVPVDQWLAVHSGARKADAET